MPEENKYTQWRKENKVIYYILQNTHLSDSKYSLKQPHSAPFRNKKNSVSVRSDFVIEFESDLATETAVI